MNSVTRALGLLAASSLVLALAACGGGSRTSAVPAAGTSMQTPDAAAMSATRSASGAHGDDPDADADDADPGPAVLPALRTQTTIGSTVDPLNGDQNPYGLDVSPVTAGLLHKGDLVICDFSDAANTEGAGSSIVALAPHPGATPVHVAQNGALTGCDALAVGPTGNIWAAAFSANDNPNVSPNGALLSTLPGGPWHRPFGQAFSPRKGPFGDGAFYETNAMDGSVVRINITSHGFTFDTIAGGFAVNGGAPGNILGPSGLQYDAAHDRLWIVDGADNSLNVLKHVTTMPPNSVAAHANGTFTGARHQDAKRVFAGAPLNGPISSALLPNGHLVLGNTGDPNGTNLMVEIAPNGKLLATKNVDTGNAGAIFGMVATGSERAPNLYYNNDNDNTLRVLAR